MKKYIYILSIISIISCAQHENKKQLDKEELMNDTRILKSLDDSLYKTGDFQYYEKYMLKIDEMIKKYPDPYRENYLKLKESMKEIYGDSQAVK